MRPRSSGGAWLAFLAGCAILQAPAPVWAAPLSAPARFDTADKVKIRGDFYAGRKDKPCILLVPNVGGKRSEEGWRALAETLAGNGYAVLSFDWRGCGDSTDVGPEFWDYNAPWGSINRNGIMHRHRGQTEISFKDFRRSYVPWLINDLCAAKHYLDTQNNANACNASDVIVVAAQDGAALSALWIASEWRRWPMIPSPLNPNLMIRDPLGSAPSGSDVAAAVWLTMPSSLNGIGVNRWLSGLIDLPGRPPIASRLPMAFIFGDKDARGKAAAKRLSDDLKRWNGGGRRLVKFASDPIPGQGKGAQLLGKRQLNTDKSIDKIIDAVMDERSPTPWHDRRDSLVIVDRQVFSLLGVSVR